MTWPWMQKSAPPVVYQCPVCRNGDFIPVSATFRPQAGQPWKLLPSGSVVRCSNCATFLWIGPDGVKQPFAAPASSPAGSPVLGQRGASGEDMLSDMRLNPAEMGV